MKSERTKIIQELIRHLEEMDAGALREQMPKPEPEVEIEVKAPSAEPMLESPEAGEEEFSDEEFEELMKG